MFKSIRWRLSGIFFMVTFLLLILLGWYLMESMTQYTQRNTQVRLLSYVRLMSDDLQDYFQKPPTRGFFQDYARKAKDDINARVTLIDINGNVLGDSVLDKDSMVNHTNRPEIKEALQGNIGESARYSSSLQEQMYYFAAPVKSDGRVLGVVRVSIPRSEIQAGQNQIRLIIGTAILAAMILMVIVSATVTPSVILPLRRMTEAAREMAEGKLDAVLPVTSDDEIGSLSEGLNYMALRLKESIRQITEERNRIKAILASMNDGVIAIDRSGNILLINPAVEQIFNIKYEQCLGKSLIEIVRNYELEILLKSVLESGKSVIKELQILAPDPRSFRISTAPLTSETGLVGVVAVMRDVTVFRQVEKMKTDFVANVSHELRTPLTSIKGFVETLLDGALADPETARRFLEIINEETNRLNRLITDLMSLSNIEAERLRIKKSPVDLGKLIINTVSILSPQAKNKGIEISVNITDSIPVVECDEDMIGQLLINLIDNAIKYTPHKGTIAVSAEPCSEGIKMAKGIKVAVKDTGIGIPVESTPRLFERFYRVDKARSREMGGTGLGLAIVKHILEVHNGSIEVESRIGQGSTFTFYLPA
jgi:two-component system phosphate regulon sensor histidine kinase PhoR